MSAIPWLHRFGRRSFMRSSALGLTGLALFGCEGGGPTVELAHPLIIGSGFGGSIAALRLAEAGVPSTVLERGRRWDITDAGDTFASIREPDERAAWLSRTTHIGISSRVVPYVGVLEKIVGDNIDAIVGAGVGGGSLVYAGMMVKPPRDLFEGLYPSFLPYDEMESTWYPRVAEMMPMARAPAEVTGHAAYAATQLFVEHAAAAGLTIERNLSAIDWDLIAAELAGDFPAEATAGDYIYGLNSGAKVSCDRTYLAQAEATGLVDVRPLHQVASLAIERSGGYRVRVERIDEQGNVLETVTYRVPAIVLAAGAIHSTRLLVEARARGDLPDLPAEVGEGWGHNGQHIFTRNNLGVSVPSYQGGPPTAVIRDYDGPIAPVTVEHGAAPFGYDCECMILPSSSLNDDLGTITYDAEIDRATIRWDPSFGATGIAAGEEVGSRLNAATAGVNGPLIGRTGFSTFHPLGGTVLGQATDPFGRVLGHPGLYVVDGALIPGATPTANPAWTIAAIAERCLDSIRADFA